MSRTSRREAEGLLDLGPAAAQRALADQPDGLRLTRAQLGSGASSLLLADRSGDEWVLHWPRGGVPAVWRWPDDAALPAVHRSVPRLLADPGWVPGPPLSTLGAVGAVDRVAYRPGRRATWRVELGSRRHVLKVVCPADLPDALLAGRLTSGLPADVARVPRMLAHCESIGAVLLDYLPGTPLDRLEPAHRAEPLADVPGLLAGLHGTPTDDPTTYAAALPGWDGGQVVRKLDALVSAVAGSAPDLARAARSVAATLAGRVLDRSRSAAVIHGDLSLRNLVWDTAAPAGTPRLGVIDWDRASLGPREADLSPLVGLLGAGAGRLVEGYERASGQPVDRTLLDALVNANRLARALRRAASGRDPLATASATVAVISHEVDLPNQR